MNNADNFAPPLTRPIGGYFFEHYQVGQKFRHAIPRTITQGDIALYQALTGSRLPLHCSEPFAQSLGYPSMPVDDLLVFHIAFGKTVPDISYNAVANLGYADCRFLQPVFIGDTLRTETEIIGLRENSNGKTGVVYVRSNCFNQRDEMVLTWIRWVMVHRQESVVSPSTTVQGVIDSPAQVSPDSIVVPAFLKRSKDMKTATGGTRFWEDYPAANTEEFHNPPQSDQPPWQFEPIKHPAGMTIDESSPFSVRYFSESCLIPSNPSTPSRSCSRPTRSFWAPTPQNAGRSKSSRRTRCPALPRARAGRTRLCSGISNWWRATSRTSPSSMRCSRTKNMACAGARACWCDPARATPGTSVSTT